MTWPQLVAILLTGVFAITASAVGQYVGGRMTHKRDERERAHRDRERFSEAKRELYFRALALVSTSTPAEFNDRISMITTLSLFDERIAAKFSEVSSAHQTAFAPLSETTREVIESITRDVAAGAITGQTELERVARERAQESVSSRLDVSGPSMQAWLDGLVDLGKSMRTSLGVAAGDDAEMSIRFSNAARTQKPISAEQDPGL